MWRGILIASACAACYSDSNHHVGPDAYIAGSDGASDVDAAVGVDAPACASGRAVYLNFDGASLTHGSPSNATTNTAAWMQGASGAAPAYHAGSPTRSADIAAITAGISQQLAAFPIAVVTVRPAAGPYVMIVFGGTAAQVTSRFGGANDQLDCGDVAKSDVAWIGDAVAPTQQIVNTAVGAIGFGLGLTATTTTTDCMCGWDNACSPDETGPCTLGGPIARDPGANQTCPGLTSQDEAATFRTEFCQ